jgi:hypothetical protein
MRVPFATMLSTRIIIVLIIYCIRHLWPFRFSIIF